MFTSSLVCYNQTPGPHFSEDRQFHIAALPILLNKSLQALKETLEGCESFNATIFYRFHVHLCKRFSIQLNDQTVYDSFFFILLLYLMNQDQSLKTFCDYNNTDAENSKFGVDNVFVETDFDISSETEVSLKHKFSTTHGYFSNP